MPDTRDGGREDEWPFRPNSFFCHHTCSGKSMACVQGRRGGGYTQASKNMDKKAKYQRIWKRTCYADKTNLSIQGVPSLMGGASGQVGLLPLQNDSALQVVVSAMRQLWFLVVV